MKASNLRMCSLLAATALLPGCGTLPSLEGRIHSVVLEHTADTRLGRAVVPLARAHLGTSGVVPLADGRDAFAARALLADAAERTLDVQYYIWHADMSAPCCSRRCTAPPTVGCGCGCCSTTTTRAASTASLPRWTHTPTSRCGCSIRFPAAGGATWAISPTSRG
jgi:hypothetical protein